MTTTAYTMKKGIFLWLTFSLFALVFVLSELQFKELQVLNFVGSLALLLLPGYLTLIALRVKDLHLFAFFALAVATSILELMVGGYAINTVLPWFGVEHPLTRTVIIRAASVGIALLMGLIWRRKSQFVEMPYKTDALFRTRTELIFALIPTVFPILAVCGALSLNAGGTGIFTLLMLIGMIAYVEVLMTRVDRLGENVIPTALFFMSLALLLMTSLRGFYITGHDIQREFGVFELTKNAGHWSIAAYKDAYNACLSITILPTLLSHLLAIPDIYIYKLLMQFVFALVPGVIFLMLRRLASAPVAFLATFSFVAFPTFFGDMPFLIRQEVAFLFLAVMVYTLMNTDFPLRARKAAFVLLGLGLILSHYSTTYIVVALLAFTWVGVPIVSWLGKHLSRVPFFAQSGFAAIEPNARAGKRLISFWMVAVLAYGSFFWSSVLTDTASGSLGRVLIETIDVIKNNMASDGHSSDVGYSLLHSRTVTPEELKTRYEKNFITPTREASPLEYYDDAVLAAFPVTLPPATRMPLTPVGKALEVVSVDVTGLHTEIRSWSAKLLQLFILLGIALTFVRRKYLETALPTEFALLGAASLAFIMAQVIVPTLSVEYGLLRAFEQSLIFLGVFVALGLMSVAFRSSDRVRLRVASSLLLLFFASSTGVLTQLTGGYEPQLHLNNAGPYYDQFYVHRGDVQAISWFTAALKAREIPYADVQSSPLTAVLLGLDANPRNDLYPALVRKGSYVVEGYVEVVKGQSVLGYEGTRISYTYPEKFLDATKDLIYTNGDSRIYK